MLRKMYYYATTMFALKNFFEKHDSQHCFYRLNFRNDEVKRKIFRRMDISTMLQKRKYERFYKNKHYGTSKQLLFDLNLVSFVLFYFLDYNLKLFLLIT